MKLITDAQADLNDLPKDWLWVQSDPTELGGYTEAYRTRDGFYYLRYHVSGQVLDHGTAVQKRTIAYVPETSQ